MPSRPDARPLAPVRGSFRAVVRAVAPAAAELDAAGWAALERIVDQALAGRPRSVRRQLVLFLRALGALSLLRFARPLARLDGNRCRSLLHRLEHSRFLPLRRGVWGVRTLAYMGYYGQPSVQRGLGYGASAAGWEAGGRTDA